MVAADWFAAARDARASNATAPGRNTQILAISGEKSNEEEKVPDIFESMIRKMLQSSAGIDGIRRFEIRTCNRTAAEIGNENREEYFSKN
jgi:hypothetical protein